MSAIVIDIRSYSSKMKRDAIRHHNVNELTEAIRWYEDAIRKHEQAKHENLTDEEMRRLHDMVIVMRRVIEQLLAKLYNNNQQE